MHDMWLRFHDVQEQAKLISGWEKSEWFSQLETGKEDIVETDLGKMQENMGFCHFFLDMSGGSTDIDM